MIFENNSLRIQNNIPSYNKNEQTKNRNRYEPKSSNVKLNSDSDDWRAEAKENAQQLNYSKDQYDYQKKSGNNYSYTPKYYKK